MQQDQGEEQQEQEEKQADGEGGEGGAGAAASAPPPACMVLDGSALANLEVLENSHDGGARGTLLQFLDHTRTAFGRRLFRAWLCAPLFAPADVARRQDAVAGLMALERGAAHGGTARFSVLVSNAQHI